MLELYTNLSKVYFYICFFYSLAKNHFQYI